MEREEKNDAPPWIGDWVSPFCFFSDCLIEREKKINMLHVFPGGFVSMAYIENRGGDILSDMMLVKRAWTDFYYFFSEGDIVCYYGIDET